MKISKHIFDYGFGYTLKYEWLLNKYQKCIIMFQNNKYFQTFYFRLHIILQKTSLKKTILTV